MKAMIFDFFEKIWYNNRGSLFYDKKGYTSPLYYIIKK